MDQVEQIKRIISDKKTSIEKLAQLLESANNQINQYNKALELLQQLSGNKWTYETYLEVERTVSGNNSGAISSSEWGALSPVQRLFLKDKVLSVIQEGDLTFRNIKAFIEAELETRKTITPTPATGPKGKVIFHRLPKIVGIAGSMEVLIDNKKICVLASGDKKSVELDPGTYTIQVAGTLSGTKSEPLTMVVEGSKEYTLAMHFTTGIFKSALIVKVV
jgi:hypothetical protein